MLCKVVVWSWKTVDFMKIWLLTSQNWVKYWPRVKNAPPIASTHREQSAVFSLSSTTFTFEKRRGLYHPPPPCTSALWKLACMGEGQTSHQEMSLYYKLSQHNFAIGLWVTVKPEHRSCSSCRFQCWCLSMSLLLPVNLHCIDASALTGSGPTSDQGGGRIPPPPVISKTVS